MKFTGKTKKKKKKYFAPELEKYKIDDLIKKWDLMAGEEPPSAIFECEP